MIAQGETAEKIAKTLDVTPRAIEQWRQRHPKFWKRRFDHHIKAVVAKTRENAGTDRVLANPDEYLRLATLADKWTVENREQLFPTSDVDLSLSGFYRTYYLPNCLSDTVEETRRQYDIALNLWRRITGDPPLRFIINTTLAKFRDTLLAMKGRGGRPYSPNTVRSKLVQIQAILDAAGPSGPRKRDAAGLIAAVPYCKPPREEQQIPRAIALDRLADVYESARMMDCPEGLDFPPVLWWRSLLSVALNTALRRNNLFSLRWEYVYLEKHQVVIPAERMRKGRRPHLVPLNADAVAHLRSIRGDATADFVFPWPYTAKSFDDKFKLLQGLAGIPPGDRFGLQAIRRTAASLLWQQCPEAAQIVLGHRSSLITLRHYVQPQVAAAGALDRLTQPWTSRPGPDDGAKLPLPEPVITAATFLGGSTP
jgi:integrase